MTIEAEIKRYRILANNERCCQKEECMILANWLEELLKYRKAEEQGLLPQLPVAIGSTIWYIGTECDWSECDDYGDYCRAYCDKHKIPKIRSMVVRQYRIKDGYVSITDTDAVYSSYENSFSVKDMGKKWFRSYEEAETALAEKGGV